MKQLIELVVVGLGVVSVVALFPEIVRIWRWLMMPPAISVTLDVGHDLEPGEHFLSTSPIDNQPRVFIVTEVAGTNLKATPDTGLNRLLLRLCGRPCLPSA